MSSLTGEKTEIFPEKPFPVASGVTSSVRASQRTAANEEKGRETKFLNSSSLTCPLAVSSPTPRLVYVSRETVLGNYETTDS